LRLGGSKRRRPFASVQHVEVVILFKEAFMANEQVSPSMSVVEQRALERVREATQRSRRAPKPRRRTARQPYEPSDTLERTSTRVSLLNPRDGLALERLMGKNDLLSINYLALGMRAGLAIGRIQVRDPAGRILGFGTGFLVSPSLLLTNNHVLAHETEATRSLVDFDFEDDVDFQPLPIATFQLEPGRFFFTDAALDFTIVAVKASSIDGRPLAAFGCLPLLPDSGKALVDESVSIIQHPGGAAKQIAIRENTIVGLLGDFIRYSTDTLGGSSGSPVFNDQWQVVALHHASVPRTNAQGKWLARDGSVWKATMGDDQVDWASNEGVRVSSIWARLRTKVDWSAGEHSLLDAIPNSPLALGALRPASPAAPAGTGIGAPIEVRELAFEVYNTRRGYDAGFLGVDVLLPSLSAELEADLAPLAQGNGHILKYTHFSLAVSRSRRLALYTAVNIDGARRVNLGPRDRDVWYFDPRMDRKYQSGPDLYSNNPLDRGHLVRRLDPVWGTRNTAAAANEDTFHFTNCAPQHSRLNQRTWLELEEFLLDGATDFGLRISVFTGPILRPDDMTYRGKFQIPAEYWKVVAMVRQDDGKLSATAYLRTQKRLIEDLEFAFADEYKTYQVPVSRIEALTGFDFGDLRTADPLAGAEATVAVREIFGPESLKLR
jgi:endonuclease G